MALITRSKDRWAQVKVKTDTEMVMEGTVSGAEIEVEKGLLPLLQEVRAGARPAEPSEVLLLPM